MTRSDLQETDGWKTLPQSWHDPVQSRLQGDETLEAWFEPDLDARLHFRVGLVFFTGQRVLAATWEDSSETHPDGREEHRWHCWPLEAVARVRSGEEAGLGTLEILGQAERLAYFSYTASRSSVAAHFGQRVNAAIKARDAKHTDVTPEANTVCPTCGAVLEADQVGCPFCVAAAAPPPSRSLYRLLRFARPRAGVILLGFLLMLACTAATMVPPGLTRPLLDNVLIPHQSGQPMNWKLVGWYLAALFASAILAWVLGWARTYVLSWASERVAADLRRETYAHLQSLSLEFFGGKRTGDLIARVGTDTDRICYFLSVNLLDFAADLLMIVMVSLYLIVTDPVLAAATLCPFPAIAWLTHHVRERLRHGFERNSRAWAGLVNVLADTIPGIRVVKAFTQERREIDRFSRVNEHVFQTANRVNRTWSFFGPTVTLMTQCGVLVIWICGVWSVAHDRVTVGVLQMFMAYIAMFYVRLESMSRMVGATQRAAASTHRVFEILDRAPSVPDPVHPVQPGRLQGTIELRRVAFQYGTRRVLHGLNLAIQPGEMIGLVGPTGAGKTTLINLICRFYDVAEGAILVDGSDIRSFPVEQYRRNIGIVLQDPFLFYGTIAENIAYGRPDATRAEVIAAARAACAHEFILRLPDGYDSMVGERGQALSGGERQRLSIARALLTDPRILILDEATSSVDTETEREIQKALDNLIHGRTTIAIAHRLSTLRKADRLVVLEQGQITEVGPHDALLEKDGTYARLYHAQVELARQNVTI